MKDWTYLIIRVGWGTWVWICKYNYILGKKESGEMVKKCLTEASFSECIGNEHKSLKVHSVLNGQTIHRKYKRKQK